MSEIKSKKESTRLIPLDYLRGFFIVVIIIDHLGRWPSLFAFITGKALLWITAAEGFVIISGLLVGYVRGFKNRSLSIIDVSKKLIGRALLLYAWSIIATIAYTALIWSVPLVGGAPVMAVAKGDWLELIIDAISLDYTYVWVHFLAYYALFLAASPIAIWLLRQSKAWLVVVISLFVLVIGWQTHIDAMQWQALFFIPSVAGYYLESIRDRWNGFTKQTRSLLVGITWTVTALTIITSAILLTYPDLTPSVAHFTDGLFAKDTISVWRLGLAFVWFIGFMLLFQHFEKWIGKYLGWLLLPIGTRSLTAYVLHGLAIIAISFTVGPVDNVLFNTVLGIIAIMAVWSLLRIPFINKVIPR